MLHRALLGSIERFFGMLIEHYAGAFPVWLAPVQAIVLPISERHQEYANQVKQELEAEGLRVEVDERSEKIGFKIRAAQTNKIPYMLVVGDRESRSGEVSVRNRFEGDQGAQSLESFLELIGELVKSRSTRP